MDRLWIVWACVNQLQRNLSGSPIVITYFSECKSRGIQNENGVGGIQRGWKSKWIEPRFSFKSSRSNGKTTMEKSKENWTARTYQEKVSFIWNSFAGKVQLYWEPLCILRNVELMQWFIFVIIFEWTHDRMTLKLMRGILHHMNNSYPFYSFFLYTTCIVYIVLNLLYSSSILFEHYFLVLSDGHLNQRKKKPLLRRLLVLSNRFSWRHKFRSRLMNQSKIIMMDRPVVWRYLVFHWKCAMQINQQRLSEHRNNQHRHYRLALILIFSVK